MAERADPRNETTARSNDPHQKWTGLDFPQKRARNFGKNPEASSRSPSRNVSQNPDHIHQQRLRKVEPRPLLVGVRFDLAVTPFLGSARPEAAENLVTIGFAGNSIGKTWSPTGMAERADSRNETTRSNDPHQKWTGLDFPQKRARNSAKPEHRRDRHPETFRRIPIISKFALIFGKRNSASTIFVVAYHPSSREVRGGRALRSTDHEAPRSILNPAGISSHCFRH